MSLRKLLFLTLVLGAVWWTFRPAPAAGWSGRAAPAEPQQIEADLPDTWRQGEYQFTPLARFASRSVVLSRRNYRGGHEGELCRTDFALGWGAMSDAAVINAMKISQDMRWFFFEWRGELPVVPGEVMHAAANMHLIPANDDVRQKLARVARHELMDFSGYLVEARHADGWSWRSSLSRSDSGGGACEVVWVEKLKHAPVTPR